MQHRASQNREDPNRDLRWQLKQINCPNKLLTSNIDIWMKFYEDKWVRIENPNKNIK